MMKKAILALLALIIGLTLIGCGGPTATPTALPTDTPVPPTATAVPPTAAAVFPTPPAVAPGGVELALRQLKLPDGDVVAVVNGVDVPLSRYRAEVERQLRALTEQYQLDWNDPETVSYLPDIQNGILEQLVDQTLLPLLAARDGVSVPVAEVDAELASLKQRTLESGSFATWDEFLAYNGVNDEEIRVLVTNSMLVTELVEAQGIDTTQEQVSAAHILVADLETAQKALARMEAGEEFADLAKELSTDPGSAELGGELGWFPRGAMVPEFEEAAFSLEIGETSEPVESQFGYHIIRVLGHEQRPLEGDQAEAAQRDAFSIWYEAERAQADVVKLITFDVGE
jgi:foldase protein PrsA